MICSSHKSIKFNLIGKLNFIDLWEEHIIDSVYGKSLLHGEVVDLGSGGGLPAIPLAIVRPDLQFTLVEANMKKSKFLNQVAAELKLDNLKIIRTRVEEIKENFFETFSCGTAKALAGTGVLLEYFSPLIKLTGDCLLFKGPDYQSEVAQANKAAVITGFHLDVVYKYKVNSKERVIVKYIKKENSKIKLPRKVGIAEKYPLFEINVQPNY
jgi:16S rRNA (guanine527-N7)-methyltransferase